MLFRVLIILFILVPSSYALEIDEKLTLRIVSTSASKKTLLINRGIEDGLIKGDHAKFFVSTGVVGRAVCIKLSPTRSVWSVYRVVNNDFLRPDQVMKLKITPAVKITKDESRMLVSDDTSPAPKDPRDLGIPLAEGADDISKGSLDFDVNKKPKWDVMSTSLLNKNREIFGMFHYSSYSDKTDPSPTGTAYSQDVSNMFFKIGGEWFFVEETKWYHRFSFLVSFLLDNSSKMAHYGTYVEEETSEFGFGVSIYPSTRPSEVYKMVHFLNYTFGLGSTTSTYTAGKESESNSFEGEVVDGSVISNTFTYGFKYYTHKGFGARMEFSYIIRSDDYAEVNNTSWLRSKSGPQISVGLAYRF